MKYIERELINIKGTIFNISATSVDWITWNNAYLLGYREPRYPMPAITTEVHFYKWAVVVAEKNDPDYKYGLITMYPHS